MVGDNSTFNLSKNMNTVRLLKNQKRLPYTLASTCSLNELYNAYKHCYFVASSRQGTSSDNHE